MAGEVYKDRRFQGAALKTSASKFKYFKFSLNLFFLFTFLLLLIFVLIDFLFINGSLVWTSVRGPSDWTMKTPQNRLKGAEVIIAADEKEKQETTTNADEELAQAASAIPIEHEEDDDLSKNSYFNMTVKMNINSPTSPIPRVLTEPTALCDTGATTASTHHPFLLMLVLSGYKEADADTRRGIRETYGSVTRGSTWPGMRPGTLVPGSTALVFLLGRPSSSADVSRTAAEQRQYGDLLVGDFVDTYRNLTLKVVFGLRWSFLWCARTRFVLKVDQDVFVNVPLMVLFLQERGEYNSVYGYPSYESKVFRQGKWKVTRAIYPLSRYPTYMVGSAYIFSMDAVANIVNASNYFAPIPVEDVFFTGILSIATGIRRISSPAFAHGVDKTELCGLKYKRFITMNINKSIAWQLMKYKTFNMCHNLSRY